MNRSHRLCLPAALAIAVSAVSIRAAKIPDKNIRLPEQKNIDGYTSTPMQPDGKWHIHDPNRPQPKVVEPQYDGAPVPAPDGATVLFDGDDVDHWKNKKWKIENGAMVATKKTQVSKENFEDIHLHVEWLVPEKCFRGWGQKQGNSGIFLMGRYEIQVLNCWGNRTYPDGMTGAIYGQTPPLVNACRKPGAWQSYDIHFKAPVFEDGKLKEPAYMTVYLNNVLVQDNTGVRGPTLWKKVPKYKPHGPGPITLQHHGNPVLFRNIWFAPLKKKLGPKK